MWRRGDVREESALDPTSAFKDEDDGSEELAGVEEVVSFAMLDLEVCRGLVIKAR